MQQKGYKIHKIQVASKHSNQKYSIQSKQSKMESQGNVAYIKKKTQ